MIAQDVKLEFLSSGVVINWNGATSGLPLLTQKTAVAVLTQAGSDRINPERGNDLAQHIYQTGVYDAQTAQHLLNFASVSARRDIRVGRDDALTDATSEVRDFQISLRGVSNNRIQTSLNVVSVAGETSGETLVI